MKNKLVPVTIILCVLFLHAFSFSNAHAESAVLVTKLGEIEVELFVEKAPRSTASFLKFIDTERFRNAGFYRVVRPDNDNGDPPITVIQGGVLDQSTVGAGDQIERENTQMTGLKHEDGTLSLARSKPGSASGGTFFICIDDQPGLDFGATRNPDRQGFAAFGRVVKGMDIVRKINAMTNVQTGVDPYVANQILAEPVMIVRAYRKTGDEH